MNFATMQFFKFLALVVSFNSTLLSPLFGADRPELGVLGIDEPAPDAVVVLGGSFGPPHEEHIRIPPWLMTKLKIPKGKMVPTYPYKPDAAPPEVSLELTRVAVDNLGNDEILEKNSIPYRSFWSRGNGHASWAGPDGKRFELEVDAFDIETKNKENALRTLRHLREEAGHARKVYWTAGSDSFLGVESWTPEWPQLFEQAHWVVINRPGVKAKNGKVVDIQRHDPLRGLFPDTFLSQYQYKFANGTHIYRNINPERPDIYLISMPALDVSSTENRASLAEAGDSEYAQINLPPSVFKKCKEMRYYSGKSDVKNQAGEFASEPHRARIFTRRNLERSLQGLFKKLINTQAAALDPQSLSDLNEMSHSLIQIAKEAAAIEGDKPWVIRLLADSYEHLVEHISELKDLKDLGRKIRETSKQYGVKKFATVYVALELAETFIFPGFMYLVAGKTGALIAPFLHPNEMITIPAFIGWTVWKNLRQKRALGGDLEMYKELTNYRNKLMRGDPYALVARLQLRKALGIDGEALGYRVVKSRLPKFIPLFIRRWDDRQVKWHDLNISTNELKAILKNPFLLDQIKKSAGGDLGLESFLLVQAINSDLRTQLVLELFIGRRYFKRLSLGQIAPELLSGFTEAEQRLIKEIKASTEDFSRELNKQDLAELSEIASDFYALNRMVQLEPYLAQDQGFWTAALDLMITQYPGKKLDLADKTTRTRLALRLNVLARILAKAQPDVFDGTAISYEGKALVRISARPQFLDAGLEGAFQEIARSPKSKRISLLAMSALTYANRVGASLLQVNDEKLNELKGRTDLLPKHDWSSEKGNFVYEMKTEEARFLHEFDVLEAGFERGVQYLKARPHDERAEKAFRQSFDIIEERVGQLRVRLKSVEYDALKIKYPYQPTGYAANENTIPGFRNVVDEHESLKQGFNDELARLRQLNHMMNGLVDVDVSKMSPLRQNLGLTLGVSPEVDAKLGRGFCEALLSRSK